MDSKQTHEKTITAAPATLRAGLLERLSDASWARVQSLLSLALALWLVLMLAGGGAIPAQEARARQLRMVVAGYGFDLVAWEVHALGDKARAWITRPAADLPYSEAKALVLAYLERAQEIRRLKEEMTRLASAAASEGVSPDAETAQQLAALQEALTAARQEQQAVRATVEQIIEGQVSWTLAQAGLGVPIGQSGQPIPPVQFTFTEPPKKLVVSPRYRIETLYTQMLTPEMDLPEIEQRESFIYHHYNLSAYITDIGGLGAFPTMVVDDADLPWILSTVAHEWTHNYLALFPLGWNYFTNSDMTTLNETVAEIVGNEIGEQTLAYFYPEIYQAQAPAPTPSEKGDQEPESPPDEPPPFDFRTEMRATRLEVDRLLAEGKVEEAEAYMEARRRLFVEHGYPLRVLNQAYFAFHGSYGTSPASTSPLGPKLAQLRALTPDIATFLHTVRGFTSVQDLERALATWSQRLAPARS
ncbi:hypothetical protein FKZ61_023175 [Litorilinea aerophila]|uniref:Uncharacterized protein n=1 Tax=Litorilinea aerophila TaxID=1204385 RepID=A0A540VAD8_9CHLR|nr:hypothetical protein [Litorilinea aerophila]MCC9079001.1 hypothetical protein [Litorilinea aerophila]GIV80108.1 MAG: hypothetical protein KatS3mg050_4502 [Litorilinea sp.]